VLVAARQGRQWYQTWGFKELALLDGAAQRSYRQTVEGLNRWRCQLEGGTPLNTLRDSAEAEGAVVLNGGVQRWVRQREIALEFVSKAA
jgi:hypothetical protein